MTRRSGDEESMRSAAAPACIDRPWIPFHLWRHGVREVNALALDLVLAGHATESAEPLCRSLLVGRAMGLNLRVPHEWFDNPSAAAAAPWKAYRLKDWVFDMTERFAELDVPEDHACSPLYDRVRDSLKTLGNPNSVAAVMDELVATILRDHAQLSALHNGQPPLGASSVGVFEVLGRLRELERFLASVTAALRSVDGPHSARIARLAPMLRLACECAEAIAEDRPAPLVILRERTPSFYQLDDAAARALLRDLLAHSPEIKVSELLGLLAGFHPTEEDRPTVLAAFHAGIKPALALLLRFWPDASSRELLRNTLDEGLAAPTSGLVKGGADPAKPVLTTLGDQISSAIILAKDHLPAPEAISYLRQYLEKSDIARFTRSALDELAEIGGPEAAAAIAPLAVTATGQLLSAVAEALEKLPSPEALDGLLSRLPDRSLRLDRLPVINALATHRPDESLRAALLGLIREPGCRCGGCVWRKALWKLAALWPDDTSREIVEAALADEPGYEGCFGAARVLANHWPDDRTIQLLEQAARRGASGSGEGDLGHLAADGLDSLAVWEKKSLAERYSEKLKDSLETEIKRLRNPAAAEDSSRRINDMIARMMMQMTAQRGSK